MSIRRRLLLVLLPGMLLVLLAGGAIVCLIVRADLIDQLDTQLRERHRALLTTASYEEGAIEVDEEEIAAVVGAAYVEFRLAGDDEPLYRSESLNGASLELDVDDRIRTVPLPFGRRGRALRTTFRLEPDDDDGRIDITGMPPSDPVTLAAAVDLRPVEQTLSALAAAFAVAGAVVLLSAVVLLIPGIHWGLAPLDRLRRQLATIDGAADESPDDMRFDDRDAPPELKPIYRELNSMLDRLEQTLRRERSFVDAAAHELRTPIAELRSTAEVALKWSDAQRTEHALRTVLEIGNEVHMLVELLLNMSRGSVDGAADDVEEVSLRPIVDRSIEFAQQQTHGKQLRATVALDRGATLCGSRSVIEAVIRNLIENAVQYTPEGGHVVIDAEPGHNGSARALTVCNGPVDLTGADVSRLFDPFWRKDASRSDRMHVGLGLSVARHLAQAGGLDLSAELRNGELLMRLADRQCD